MGKLFFWFIVGVLVMLLLRHFGTTSRLRRQSGDAAAGRVDASTQPAATDVILACHVCGVHLPAAEAVFAHGRVYCCDEHRQQDRHALEHQKLR